MIVAIDPGIDGAIATLDQHAKESISVYDMPSSSKDSGKGRQLAVPHLVSLIRYWASTVCVVERVGPMPKQGVSSVFSFGRTVGAIEGVVVALGWPIVYVNPRAWKKHHGLEGKDKDASRTRALQLYPYLAPVLSRKKDVDRAEAVLMARWYLDTRTP